MKIHFIFTIIIASALSACGQINDTIPNEFNSKIVQKNAFRYKMCGYIARPGGGTGGSSDVKIQTGSGTYTLISNNPNLTALLNQVNDTYIGCAYGDEIKQGYEGALLVIKKLELQGMS